MDTLDRGNTAAGIVLSATHGGLSRAVALSRATPNISNNIGRVWEEVTTYNTEAGWFIFYFYRSGFKCFIM